MLRHYYLRFFNIDLLSLSIECSIKLSKKKARIHRPAANGVGEPTACDYLVIN
jgi:hypothetical protein